MSDKTLQENADALRSVLANILENAKTDEVSEPFNKEISNDVMSNVSRPSSEQNESKKLVGIKTDTFLDEIFLDNDDKSIDGIPAVSNTILTGLPSSGKSLLIAELLIKLAQNNKVIFVTSEDMWTSTSGRYDLETRVMEKAKKLGIDWSKIFINMYIIDTVEHAELRDWINFITTYRRLVEGEKATILLVDSLTLLEDNRGALKRRLLELMRYNQKKGITSILINQRAIEEVDNLAMAGGISLSHIVDIVMVMDYKKVWSGDAQIKDDTGAKQGETINFFRILKCRLCKTLVNYKRYEIIKDGMINLINKPEFNISEEK